MPNRCKFLEFPDHAAAEEELINCRGASAVVMPHTEIISEVWTNSIKVATKLMNLPDRYSHIGTHRKSGIPIHKFHSQDGQDAIHSIMETVRAESLRLHPIHHELLIH